MFKIVYGIGFIMIFIIRLPYWWLARGTRVVVDRETVRDRVLLALLSGRDQRVSARLRLHVVAELRRLLASIVDGVDGGPRFSRSASGCCGAPTPRWGDIGRIRSNCGRDTKLVTNGIYRHIRHPMYAFGWLLGSPKPCCCGTGSWPWPVWRRSP